MWEKPIWERVTFLEATVPSMMEKIDRLDKTLMSFIKEIRDVYATKKELNEVKDKIYTEEENEITKEVASMNNKRLIWVVIIQWVFAICIALVGILK